MNADLTDFKYTELTEQIIKAYYKVYTALGYGFLEKVYENSLLLELKNQSLHVLAQSPIKVMYEGQIVGQYTADLLVEDKVIVEIKAVKILVAEHEAQLLNYLKATSVEVGLLLNFGPKPEVKRKIFDRTRKSAKRQNDQR